MSRRKQSNPKPLKREDVWGSDEEGGASATAAGSNPGSGAHSPVSGQGEDEGSEMKIEIDVTEDGTSIKDEPPSSPPQQLRLRLNTSLATDPAQRKEQVQDRSSPEETNSRSLRPELELLPGAAFPSVPVSSPGSNPLFCLPPTPETNHVLPGASPTPSRVKQEASEPPTPPPPPRQVVNCYVCQPCGIRFSSISTLEAHQTYYCSHRPSALAAAAALQNNRSSSPSTPHTGGSGKGESDGELGSPRSGGPTTDDDGPAAKVPRTGRQYGCPHCSYSADKKVSLNRHMRMHAPAAPCPPPSPANTTAPSDSEANTDESAAPPLPPPPLDRYCADCDIRFSSIKTYRAHKTHYCSTRHVVKPPPAISPAAASQTSSGAEDRVPVTRGSTASSPAGSPPAHTAFLALPTSPVLLVPYQLVQAASLLSSHSLPPGAATAAAGSCLLLMNGMVRPLTLPTPASPPSPELVTPRPPPKLQRQPSEPTMVREVPPSSGSPIPLDLSVPRSSSSLHPSSESPSPRSRLHDPEDEKENRGLNTSSPSLSSPASSPSSASPRPPRQNGILPTVPKKQEPSSEHSNGSSARKTPTMQIPIHKIPKQPVILPELLAPLLSSHLALLPGPLQAPILAAAAASSLPSSNHVSSASSPQVLVKKGVSKCAECNIVFCQMENYMAHKKHYCSARQIEESSSPESGVVTAKSASPSPNPGQIQAATPPLAFPGKTHLQYICGACQIKFSSIATLKAHQTYYCLKRDTTANNMANTNNNDPPPEKKKCSKCKVILPSDESASPHQCTGSMVSGGNSWRCPCCGISCPTATAAQKHLEEAHTGVLKAFRCTICRYRGNTLRGMRTHIRIHFSEADKTGELREEDFISCVLVGEPEPRPVEEEPHSTEEEKSVESLERNHCCDQCNYSSNYKGNLIRHMKSVHERSESSSPPPRPVSSPSPEALIVKLEPSEEKISFTEDPPPPSSSPSDAGTVTARYWQPSSTLAVSPASTPRPEASAHT